MKKQTIYSRKDFLVFFFSCYFLTTAIVFYLTDIAASNMSLSILILSASGLAAVITWFPAILDISRSSIKGVSPICLQAIGYLTFFIIPAIHIAIFPEWDYFKVSEFFPRVLILLAIGYICMLIGYRSKVGFLMANILRKRLPFPSYNLHVRGVNLSLLWFYIIGWFARIILILRGTYYHTAQSNFRFTGVGNLLGQIEWLCKLMFIFFLVRYLFRPKSSETRLAVFAVGSIETLYNLLAGNRQQLIELFVYIFVAYSMIRRVFPWKFGLIIGLLLMVFMFPFVAQYRLIVGYQYYRSGTINILGALKEAISQFSSGQMGIFEGIQQTIHRNSDIVPVAAIIRDTPKYLDFQYGKTYLGLLFFFIPRAIWPGKPTLLTAIWTTERYLGLDPYNYSIAPTTLLGEFYLNFGELGIIFGMALWGIFLQFLYSYTKSGYIKNPSYLIFYSFMSIYFLWVSQTAAVTIIAIRIWIMIYLISLYLYIIERKISRASKPQSQTN